MHPISGKPTAGKYTEKHSFIDDFVDNFLKDVREESGRQWTSNSNSNTISLK